MLDELRRVPLPDVHTAAYDSVAFDTTPERMAEDPHAWMRETELVFALRVQAGTLPVVKERITMALNARGEYGPKVDRNLGAEEPTVDWWEEGKAIPTPAQVRRLAEYTEFQLQYFYTPLDKSGPIAYAWVGRGRGRHRRRVPIELNPPPRAQRTLF
jgi:hypothetical protein